MDALNIVFMVNDLGPLFDALADPTRRQVVQLLSEGPRRAGEITRGSGQDNQGQDNQGGGAPAGLGGGGLGTGLGGLPEGFPESLADGLANLPPGLNFPSPAQNNIPAAFRGGNNKRRDKKK